LKQEQNIHGAAAAIAKPCLYAIIHTENIRTKNLLSSLRNKQQPYIYAAAQQRKLPLSVTAAITAKKSDGYRNRT